MTGEGQEKGQRATRDMTYVKCFNSNTYGHMASQCREQGGALQHTVQTLGRDAKIMFGVWTSGTRL